MKLTVNLNFQLIHISIITIEYVFLTVHFEGNSQIICIKTRIIHIIYTKFEPTTFYIRKHICTNQSGVDEKTIRPLNIFV